MCPSIGRCSNLTVSNCCTFSGFHGPKASSGGRLTVRRSPARKPNRAFSKPGSKLPSPITRLTGSSRLRVLSISTPFSMQTEKCNSTFEPSLTRVSSLGLIKSVIIYFGTLDTVFFEKKGIDQQKDRS